MPQVSIGLVVNLDTGEEQSFMTLAMPRGKVTLQIDGTSFVLLLDSLEGEKKDEQTTGNNG